MPEPNVITWTTLLGACRIHGDVERGERAAKEIMRLEPREASAYVLLGNMYAAKGMHKESQSAWQYMADQHIRKIPGISWITVKGVLHSFVVGDTSHPQSAEIHEQINKIQEALDKAGYLPKTWVVLHDIPEAAKVHHLCTHSERLAIAFGLIALPPGTPLRIFKNLRVCMDCHEVTKWISKLCNRDIILRDARRFHHFVGGKCSCNDRW
jgi:hypothetical protein